MSKYTIEDLHKEIDSHRKKYKFIAISEEHASINVMSKKIVELTNRIQELFYIANRETNEGS